MAELVTDLKTERTVAERGKIHLQPTRCAICKTTDHAKELYSANFAAEALNPQVFSARRMPDRIHFRVVRCDRCGLIRSDPVIDTSVLNELYSRSTFEYGSEAHNLRRTYGRYLARVRRLATRCESLLEIGCGNGFFLEEAVAQGIADVAGVEPSAVAIDAAPTGIRERIVCDVLRPGLFPSERFDLICFFQIFDHVPDPADFVDICWKLLRPGGMVLALNHNAESLSARIMKEKSPIVDIEHMYLYSPKTMEHLFTNAGFEVLEAGNVWSRYSLYYLTRLVPLPRLVKRACLSALEWSRLGRIPLNVPLGNLYQMARKPS